MKKYGFFGGSFNPVTNAHVELAKEIREKFNLDKVIFVPMGDNYKKEGLISEKHRYNMLKLATQGCDYLEVSTIELNQNRSLTTKEAFKMIEKAYPDVEKYYIMGADNVHKILKSKDLANNYKYIVIERNEINIEHKENFTILKNKKHYNTTATSVRERIKENNFTIEMIDENVFKYIKENKLYKNP